MGFKKWFARKGAIGGTARAVAKAWLTFQAQDPTMTNKELAEAYIGFRYGSTGEMELLVNAMSQIENDETVSPGHLAWIILLVENPRDGQVFIKNMDDWMQIIDEEMEKMGLDPDNG